MTASPATHADGPSSWLSSILCCAPLASCLGGRSRRSKFTSLTTDSISWPLGRTSDQDLLIDQGEKDAAPIVQEQPITQGHPFARSLPAPNVVDVFGQHYPRKSSASGRTVATLKKRFRSDGSSRRSHISGPSNFQHIQSGSFQFPLSEAPIATPRGNRRNRSSFRPLELSIYMRNQHMSPILSHFEFPSVVSPPEPAHLQERLDEDHQLIRQRTNSSTPFHLPRKPVSNPSISISSGDDAPAIPVKSQARARAHTSPELETIKARVAGAMIEVDRLQKQIDDVVERQSLYVCSRPSTAHSMAHTMPELEPMPSIPALPPAAPSFAERLNSPSPFEKPQTTTPLKDAFEISNRSQEFGEGKTTVSSPSRSKFNERVLPPPLPLVLRPPLRKKKSFSRVSTWLFPGSQHSRDMSLDSITNLPRPVKGTEGFYQCVAPGDDGRRSFDSVGSVTTWDSEEEQRTVPSTLSPESTPIAKHDGPKLERTTTFGRSSMARSTRPFVGAVA